MLEQLTQGLEFLSGNVFYVFGALLVLVLILGAAYTWWSGGPSAGSGSRQPEPGAKADPEITQLAAQINAELAAPLHD